MAGYTTTYSGAGYHTVTAAFGNVSNILIASSGQVTLNNTGVTGNIYECAFIGCKVLTSGSGFIANNSVFLSINGNMAASTCVQSTLIGNISAPLSVTSSLLLGGAGGISGVTMQAVITNCFIKTGSGILTTSTASGGASLANTNLFGGSGAVGADGSLANSFVIGGSGAVTFTGKFGNANDLVFGGSGGVVFGTATGNITDSFIANGSGSAFTIPSGTNKTFITAFTNYLLYTNTAFSLGVSLAPDAVSWGQICDRNKKENIIDIDCVSVLDRLDQLPLYQYNYIGQGDLITNIGPMAQDWHPLFPNGKDQLKIETIDFDGVALASIKGLYAKVKAQAAAAAALAADQAATIAAQASAIADLLARVAVLEMPRT